MKNANRITRAATLAIVFAILAGSLWARPYRTSQLSLDAAMAKPVMLAGEKQTAYLRVALQGFSLEEPGCRPPVNIAIVIDKSGSMTGDKIRNAKKAAIMAIERLGPEDIISIVTYDSGVNVVVPATKVRDKQAIFCAIRRIEAGGSTALYAGVQKGAREMRKFLCGNRVSRLVLLSDGLANVGPQSPCQLGKLGTSLIKDGISVTTIGLGLGYNEDLMTQLAYKSDGSHYFAENASELAGVFDDEFGRALSVVAQEVQIDIRCAKGVRPVRLLGREGKISGRNVSVFINHFYSEHKKYFILEVEVPKSSEHQTRKIAMVNVRYDNMKTGTSDELSNCPQVKFTNSLAAVESSINSDVMVDVVEQLATERNELATTLRDKGKTKEAQQMLLDNAAYLKFNADRYNSKKLERYGELNDWDSKNLDGSSWTRQRKSMRQAQSENKYQR